MTNVSLKIETRECVPDNQFLGYEGENEVNKLIFKFENGFFDGSGLLNIQRGEQKGYVAVNKVGETYELSVENSLLSQKGDVRFQLSITSIEGKVIKFDPFVMIVKDAIDTDTELPEEYPSWIDEANAKLAEMDKAIEDAEKLDAKVEPTQNGALITITGKDGITTAEVLHGTGEGTGGGIAAETDPTVPSWAKQPSKPSYTKAEVGLGNVDNVRQYSTINPPPYPVTSVNGKTGAVTITVPTKTSELTNDSNFASETFVKNEIANAQLGGEGGEIDLSGYATKDELPTKTSDLENDSGFLTEETDPTVPSWAKATSKPTYTKTEIGLGSVDNVKQYSVNNPPPYPVTSVNGNTGAVVIDVPSKTSELTNDSNFATLEQVEEEIATFDFIKVVDVLPETGLENRFYFVPKADSDTQDLFDEFAWINNQWEYIATKRMEVDLTDYATKEELNDKQDTLVSGTNIKTVNNQSILGKGNIAITGGSGGGSNPTGTIISFMGLIAPDGYLICDGSELNIDVFPELANHFETQFGAKNHFGGDGTTTFALPDLRNEFLRGYHGGADTELSGEVGIHQDATEHQRVSTYDGSNIAADVKENYKIDYDVNRNRDTDINNDGTSRYWTTSTSKFYSATTTDYEQYYAYTSRPTNVAVLYCIKY